MKQATHEELVTAKDREDWDFLWRAAIPLVNFTVGRFLRNRATPMRRTAREDLRQDGMLAAGDAIRSWRTFESFPGWVRRKVEHALIDHVRSRSKNEHPRQVGLADEFAVKTHETSDSLSHVFSDDELLEDVIATLRDPNERTVIRAYMAGYSYAEIAQQHDKSLRWAKGMLSSCKKKCTKHLGVSHTSSNRRKA